MSFNIERTFKHVPVIKKESESLLHHITKYEGEISTVEGGITTYLLPYLQVKPIVDTYAWNKHMIVPLVGGDLVFVHPDQTGVDPQYIRIIYSEHKAVAIYSKMHFDSNILIGYDSLKANTTGSSSGPFGAPDGNR